MSRRRVLVRRWCAGIAVLLAAVLVVLGARALTGGPPGASLPPGRAAPPSVESAAAARSLLAQIPVRGRAAKTGYRRALFGNGWASVAGCDERNRVLARDLTDVSFRPGTRDCVVTSGTLHDPYTGETVPFVRGNRTSSLVQIDHRVPLLLAWQQGAQQWDEQRRRQFANDPDNLVAVQGHVNQSKGASGPGSWLPPNKAYRCAYVIAFVEVTARYSLSMNPGDVAGASRVLQRCPP